MIFVIPLRPGTILTNVRYKWTYLGGEGDEQLNGITQPTIYSLFRISADRPVNAEELMVYDSTDSTNFKVVPAK